MKCLHPISLVLDGKRQFVPCGKCNYCLETRRSHWSFRLTQELFSSTGCYFVTLTYDDQKIPVTSDGIPTLKKEHVQKFLKRFRHLAPQSRIRYYAVGEYGTRTSRPHYHILLFNVPRPALDKLPETWGLGNCDIGTVTPASIHYVTKYHVNVVSPAELNGRSPPFWYYES